MPVRALTSASAGLVMQELMRWRAPLANTWLRCSPFRRGVADPWRSTPRRAGGTVYWLAVSACCAVVCGPDANCYATRSEPSGLSGPSQAVMSKDPLTRPGRPRSWART